MIEFLMTALMLAQNETEKSKTLIGFTFLGVFIGIMVLDSIIKNKYVPKKGPMRAFLICMFLAIVIIVGFLLIYNK